MGPGGKTEEHPPAAIRGGIRRADVGDVKSWQLRSLGSRGFDDRRDGGDRSLGSRVMALFALCELIAPSL